MEHIASFHKKIKHIGDNCFANVIFQSLQFVDFSTEVHHYLKATGTWSKKQQKQVVKSYPKNLIYHSAFIDMFSTRIFKKFQPEGYWKLEKAYIQYNDDYIKLNIESN